MQTSEASLFACERMLWYCVKVFSKGDILMKKYKLISLLVIMVTIISGCAINADASREVTYPVLSEALEVDAEPARFETETVYEDLEEPQIIERSARTVVAGGTSWMYAKTQDGVRGTKGTKYKLTYNIKDELISRIEIPNAEIVDATSPTLYEGGQKAQAGAYYDISRITRYGVDCVGCNMNAEGKGGTASGVGVGLDSVRQKNGTWKPGVTYEGYYVIATSSAIPMCTILEISNHKLNGSGITPGVPFKAIVLDRGSAIQGSKIDLFAGSESNMLIGGSTGNAKATILSMNSRTKTNGSYNCGV